MLGERSSGTNFIKRLLGRNTVLRPTEMLGWKHGFVQAMAVPSDLAVVCVVRRADDWALSMHAKPWHTTAEMQALAFPDFLRAPWDTIIDRPRYFEGLGPESLGQPLQQDRNPLDGTRFANLFALRRAKLVSLLSYLQRDCTCILLRMEDAQAAPDTALDALCAGLDLPPRDQEFRPVLKRLGAKFKTAITTPRPAPPETLSTADRELMRSELDLDLEAALGYRYD